MCGPQLVHKTNAGSPSRASDGPHSRFSKLSIILKEEHYAILGSSTGN
jgi:hypothetical protein